MRGTVQADILKEDQGQNTCIFSTEFSLKVMGDIQEYFVHHQRAQFLFGLDLRLSHRRSRARIRFRNWRSRWPTASPMSKRIWRAACTSTISRPICPSSSPTAWTRNTRCWAAWRGASGPSRCATNTAPTSARQKLKYHIQTSGRSLHAQEIDFNDIRTTLQALIAIYDNCNSLHTNAYDEAITTPTDESVRRALAIQLIINREWGLAKNENPNQGSFIIEELTDLVEEAVLAGIRAHRRARRRAGRDGDRLSARQDSGRVDALRACASTTAPADHRRQHLPQPEEHRHRAAIELARSTDEEKQSQLTRLADFHQRHAAEAPQMLAALQQAVIHDENVFAKLMDAVRVCSLGQITDALFAVGGQYRRNM